MGWILPKTVMFQVRWSKFWRFSLANNHMGSCKHTSPWKYRVSWSRHIPTCWYWDPFTSEICRNQLFWAFWDQYFNLESLARAEIATRTSRSHGFGSATKVSFIEIQNPRRHTPQTNGKPFFVFRFEAQKSVGPPAHGPPAHGVLLK